MKKPLKYLIEYLPVMVFMLGYYSLTNSVSTKSLCHITIAGVPVESIHDIQICGSLSDKQTKCFFDLDIPEYSSFTLK